MSNTVKMPALFRHPGRITLLLALTLAGSTVGRADEQSPLVLDNDVWATFYDVPSRRFRSIRDAFIRRDFETVSRDLEVAIVFLSVEVERAIAQLSEPMGDNLARLKSLHSTMRDTSVSVADFDATFARAHWLLAQHYLVLAKVARDTARHKNAGQYLWGTAHHLERAVLWSGSRIDRSVYSALESTRDMGTALQTTSRPEQVYRDRPVAATTKVLKDIGAQLDRTVWVLDALPKTP